MKNACVVNFMDHGSAQLLPAVVRVLHGELDVLGFTSYRFEPDLVEAIAAVRGLVVAVSIFTIDKDENGVAVIYSYEVTRKV